LAAFFWLPTSKCSAKNVKRNRFVLL
jgi:hypothetical protein